MIDFSDTKWDKHIVTCYQQEPNLDELLKNEDRPFLTYDYNQRLSINQKADNMGRIIRELGENLDDLCILEKMLVEAGFVFQECYTQEGDPITHKDVSIGSYYSFDNLYIHPNGDEVLISYTGIQIEELDQVQMPYILEAILITYPPTPTGREIGKKLEEKIYFHDGIQFEYTATQTTTMKELEQQAEEN